MKKSLLLLVLVATIGSLNAQNKRELIAQIDELKTELSQKDSVIASAQQQEKISTARASVFEQQVNELQAANATLLKNLKIFTEASSRRSESIGATLESLREKEARLKVINDEFAKGDSIALLMVTDFKNSLGEGAQIKVGQGMLALPISQDILVGDDENADSLSIKGKEYVLKVAQVLKKYPSWELMLITQDNGMIDKENRDAQISAILGIIDQETGMPAWQIKQNKLDGLINALEIRLHPNYADFYRTIRKRMKN
jgi:chemotaxis protein MotB